MQNKSSDVSQCISKLISKRYAIQMQNCTKHHTILHNGTWPANPAVNLKFEKKEDSEKELITNRTRISLAQYLYTWQLLNYSKTHYSLIE